MAKSIGFLKENNLQPRLKSMDSRKTQSRPRRLQAPRKSQLLRKSSLKILISILCRFRLMELHMLISTPPNNLTPCNSYQGPLTQLLNKLLSDIGLPIFRMGLTMVTLLIGHLSPYPFKFTRLPGTTMWREWLQIVPIS